MDQQETTHRIPHKKDMRSQRFTRSMKESFSHAWDGLSYAYGSQRNMRIHTVVGSLVIGASIGAGLSNQELLMVFVAIAVVLSSEVVNTLSESIVDLLEPNFSLIAKRVKDVAAGGVLLGAVFSVVIGFIAFYPALIDFSGRFSSFASYRWKYVLAYALIVIVPAILGFLYYEVGPGRCKARWKEMGFSGNPQRDLPFRGEGRPLS